MTSPVLLLFFACFTYCNGFSTSCGYESCPKGKPDMLNVHIVCHTHDDVGWVRTVDEYYDGAGETYLVTVKKILDSVVKQLPLKPERKFIYVETAFFWHWWQEQNATTRAKVQRLVQSGQLEFVGGGWVMNDEGSVHYSDTIDQMTLGLRRLRELFGKCGVPKVIWQIDPFGHSREQASLFNQMGFEGLFLGRIHYQDKTVRKQSRTMEFVWNTSASLGKQAELFTGILYDEYSAPKGFCFDYVCSDPYIDLENVESRGEDFIKLVQNQAKSYGTNNVMVTMGGDFTYVRAETWFQSLDRLIKYINYAQQLGTKVNAFYSTPSCYLQAVRQSKKIWTIKSDDFFPYASSPITYWTGYFTSRPSFKAYVREASKTLHACRQLQFISFEYADREINRTDIRDLKEALGVAQHHDAVSGTAKQYVTNDYTRQLFKGIKKCQKVISEAYESILPTNDLYKETFCNSLNISYCKITEISHLFAVTVYNSLGQEVPYVVRLPVTRGRFEIMGPIADKIENQLVPLPRSLLTIPLRHKSRATHSLLFKTTLPPLGFQRFLVKKFEDEDSDSTEEPEDSDSETHILSNKFFTLYFDRKHGLLRGLTDKMDNISIFLSQNFYYYKSHPYKSWNGSYLTQASGAYIFLPKGEALPIATTSSIKIIKGPIYDEVHQTFSSWASQVIRLPKNEKYIEFEWLIGPIPVKDDVGKEVITRFETNLETNELFYTDANGREILERRRDYQPTWELNVTEPIAGNYYPVNSRIFMRDEAKDIQVTLLTDRSVGGSSLKDGSLEIMLHRRILHDDGKGVSEALNELGYNKKGLVVRGRILLLIDQIDESARGHREMSQRLFLEPQLSFRKVPRETENNLLSEIGQFSALKAALPPNVHLLTLEALNEPLVLLRLEHFYEKSEHEEMSQDVRIDLQTLFKRSTILTVRETTLAANQLLNENEEDFQSNPYEKGSSIEGGPNGFVISLAPMQIRTFIIELNKILVY